MLISVYHMGEEKKSEKIFCLCNNPPGQGVL